MKFLLLKYFGMARAMQKLIAQNLSTLINTQIAIAKILADLNLAVR